MDSEKRVCEFAVFRDGKWYKCTREAYGIARCSDLCFTHDHLIKRDNKTRNIKGLEIPENFQLIVKFSKIADKLCTQECNEPTIKPKEICEDDGSAVETICDEEEI
jgi:hypothetical protein